MAILPLDVCVVVVVLNGERNETVREYAGAKRALPDNLLGQRVESGPECFDHCGVVEMISRARTTRTAACCCV